MCKHSNVFSLAVLMVEGLTYINRRQNRSSVFRIMQGDYVPPGLTPRSSLGREIQGAEKKVSFCRRTVVWGCSQKEVQDSSCQGSGGVPQFLNYPKIGGYRGLKNVPKCSYEQVAQKVTLWIR